MKKILILLFLINIPYFLFSQYNESDLTINITNISNDNGQLIIKLYNSEENFLKSSFQTINTKIINGKSKLVIENIPAGNYAIAIIHDENKNNKLDFNIFGIPSENTAASNNAKAFFGPPSYKNAYFVVNKPVIQNIEM